MKSLLEVAMQACDADVVELQSQWSLRTIGAVQKIR